RSPRKILSISTPCCRPTAYHQPTPRRPPRMDRRPHQTKQPHKAKQGFMAPRVADETLRVGSHARRARKGPEPLFFGDCLDGIPTQTKHFGPFDLIYVDPPYNAGGTRGARKGEGHRSEGALAYKDAWGGLDGFLAMFEPRLIKMHEA